MGVRHLGQKQARQGIVCQLPLLALLYTAFLQVLGYTGFDDAHLMGKDLLDRSCSAVCLATVVVIWN